MLQASAQSMHGPPPPRQGLPVSANLFSFVPTPSAAATAPNGDNDRSTNALGTTTDIATLGSGAPATTAGIATRLASAAAGMGAFSGGGVGSGLGVGLEAGDVWESAILDGGGGGGMLEALDETSLRMEMQTSIDMHRLMRSRQKVRILI